MRLITFCFRMNEYFHR